MPALAARIAARQSIFASGSIANALNTESSGDSSIERCDVEVEECAIPEWEVVDMRVVGGASDDMDTEEGGGTTMIGHGVVDWDVCICGCGYD